jgi:anion-transporting  ArsA/GET3 family ATPase
VSLSERRLELSPFTDALLRRSTVLVCCGAGGVGKTTTAAALGLAGAMLGRRVLVLTIDPARRLAEAMAIPESGPAPSSVPASHLSAAKATGALDAWMLDPKVVFEGMVRRLAGDPEKVQRILANRLYRALSELVAGMQEYTAAEALYSFVESGHYDLVVLDTPPSRNALEFLEAPRKLSLFLDEKIVGVFLPGGGGGGLFAKRAKQLVASVFERAFGPGFFEDVQEFLTAFSGMFSSMRAHAEAVRTLLTSEASSFLVVTSPEPTALDEARFLQEKLREMHLPFGGYVLNRSWAYTRGFREPETLALPEDAPPKLRSAHAKLVALGRAERRLADRDRALLSELRARGGNATATPHLGGAIEDFGGIASLAEGLVVR